MVDRVVRVQLVGDASSLIREAERAAAALRGIGSSSSSAGSQAASGANQAQSAWEKFKSSVAGQVAVGDLISKGVGGAFGALASGVKSVVEQGLDFERNMNTLQAVTGATDAQMAKLSATAKRLGSDVTIPGASAGSAAAAMQELAKGGLTVDQTMTAAAGTLRLAAAAQVDGAKAAEIQANALNAFRLKADQADHVADLLANSANAASGEVTDMASALQQSATVAAGFGISIDETTTTLALFAKNGILGSDAGTSFKTMLTALASPTAAQTKALDDLGVKVYDANGKFVGMREVTDQLAKAHQRMTVEQYNAAASTAFGTDAIRAANILGQEATAGYDNMTTSVNKNGGAQELAAAQTKGLSGALGNLENQASGVAISLYEKLEPALAGVTNFGATAFGWLGDAVGWMTQLPAPVWAGVTALGAMILLKGPLNALFIQAIAGYTRMALAVRGASFSFAGIATAAKGALAAIGGPFGLAVVGVTTALSFFATSTDDAAGAQEDFAGALDQTTGKLNEQAAATISAKVSSSGLGEQYQVLGGNVADLVDAIGGIPEAQERVKATLDAARDAASAAGGAYTNAGAAIAAGGGEMTLTSDQLAQSTDALSGKLAQIQGTGDLYNQLLVAMSGAQSDAEVAAAGLTGQLGKTGKELEDNEKSATPFADALKAVRDAASEADASTNFFITTMQMLRDGSISADQAARQNAAALREIGASARALAAANADVAKKQDEFDKIASHLGQTLDGQAVSATNLAVTQADVDQAARDLADAQDRAADAADRVSDTAIKAADSAVTYTDSVYQNALKQGDYQKAVDAAVLAMAGQRASFIENQIQAGKTREEAVKLADQLHLIPNEVRTTYDSPGAFDAITRAKELNDALDKIDARTVHYSVVGGEVTTVGAEKAGTGRLAVFATGGVIPGPVSHKDNTIIGARTGEAVMVPQFVSAVGGESGVHRLNRLAESGMLQMFANGGVVNAKVSGDYKAGDWIGSLGSYIERLNQIIKNSLGSISGGLNPSQDPSSFGWQRGAGIVPFSWNGNPFVGGVADRTQSLWTGLLNALVPQIPGGLMAPIWAYENRNNVNSPGNASFHAYGLAADINAPQNPNGAPGDGRSGPGVIPAGVARQLAARFGMEWGGDFRGTPDPMHFEIHVSPSQIGAGGTINLGSGGGGGAGVEQWRSTVLQALGITGQSPAWADAVLKQMNSESSGNPRAVNTWDRNFPLYGGSKGLMQVIPPTFAQYALPGYNTDIFDPLSNVIASIRYVMATYPEGIARFNRAQAYDNGGILPPGFTMAYNGTGSNEAIFTGQQFNAMAAQAVGPRQPLQIEVSFGGDGVITQAMADTARVTVNGALAETARVLTTAGAQSW